MAKASSTPKNINFSVCCLTLLGFCIKNKKGSKSIGNALTNCLTARSNSPVNKPNTRGANRSREMPNRGVTKAQLTFLSFTAKNRLIANKAISTIVLN